MKIPNTWLTDQSLRTLIKHRARHKQNGNGFGIHVADVRGISKTVTNKPDRASESIFIGYRIGDLNER